MAILQYSNGIIEDFKAEGLTFTDNELLDILAGYDDIRTLRLIEVPNTWCIWGHSDDSDPIEFNRIATGIVGEDINSPMVMIHDGELDPAWNLNDPIILNSYEDFKNDVLLFIDDIAKDVLTTEKTPLDGESSDNLMFLTTLGPTKDKKVLFEFNQHKQSKDFFKPNNFSQFSDKVQDYWNQFFIENLEMDDNTCVIYADLKMIVIVEDKNVIHLMKTFIDYFESVENYELCTSINNYIKAWKKYIKKNKKVKEPKQIPEKTKNQDIDKKDEKDEKS